MISGARRSGPPQIRVRNLQRRVQVNLSSLQEFAEGALQLCLRSAPAGETRLEQLPEIFVLIISDRRMAALHRQFLNEAGPTDVITFEHGEIFLSAETARRNARQFGNSLLRELQLYVVHGLLHLHGFEDRTERGSRRMRVIQDRILEAGNR